MNRNILHIDSVGDYNCLLGVGTLHPLVSVVDFSTLSPMRHARCLYNVYAVFLKDALCGEMLYGRQRYDYAEGTVVCVAPGQVLGVDGDDRLYEPKGWALVFHPDFIRGTALGRNIREYTFFSYEANEALHLSEQEHTIVVDCMQHIRREMEHATDRHSRRLITVHIETLLDYCLRFYERQFVTRRQSCHDTLSRFEALLDDYFASGRAMREGLPTVKHFAGELCLSANYFGDLIKKETGKSAKEFIQLKLIGAAKARLLDPQKNISTVAYELGFQYPQHMARLFKKLTGMAPNVYRRQEG